MKYRLAAAAILIVICAHGEGQPGTQKYEYDKSGRLIRTRYSSGIVIEYTYDAAGNRTRKAVGKAASSEQKPVATGMATNTAGIVQSVVVAKPVTNAPGAAARARHSLTTEPAGAKP